MRSWRTVVLHTVARTVVSERRSHMRQRTTASRGSCKNRVRLAAWEGTHMSTHRKTRDSRIPKMKVPVENNTVEDAIIIEDDGPFMEVKEELVDMMDIDLNEPSSSSRLPHSEEGIVPLPHFSQIEGLDFLSIEIGVMEYGVELWTLIHCLIGWSSHKEMIQLLELLEKTTMNLTAFGVPKAYQHRGIMGELALMAAEILKMERLISPH
ncbi:hypothetical protein AMTR_s00083p00177080 [Amborella trichopoda]|uniref:Uncharacterized protein n=1 Tax=Amborella trichopoda TaxID=13333 RepID=W1NY39_AMBTC|nr:hypothetical protein AMTR_s00083p00177080 [Amborella trichopoda]